MYTFPQGQPPPGGYAPPPGQGGYGPPMGQPGYGAPPMGQPGYGAPPMGQTGYGPPLPMPPPMAPPPGYHQATADAPKPGDDPAFAGTSFSDKAIRRSFIRKVYLILTAQLMVTFAFIAVFVFVQPVKQFVRENTWVYYMSYGLFLVTYIVLICCESVRRKFPGNFICLAVLTVAMSYMTGTISSMYDTEVVLIAIGITAGVCLSVTLFSIQTKFDFTKWGGVLFVASMVLFIFGIVAIFTYNRIIYTIYAALIALVFTAFLAYDTQLVMGGRKYQISPEEYITGALQLYVDVIYIFWAILALTGMARD